MDISVFVRLFSNKIVVTVSQSLLYLNICLSIDPPNYASIGFINELKSSRTYTTRPHTNEIEDVRRVGVMPKWASVEVVLCKHGKIVLHWYITLITVLGIHSSSAPQTEKGICITFKQRRPNVETLGRRCTNVVQMVCVFWDPYLCQHFPSVLLG